MMSEALHTRKCAIVLAHGVGATQAGDMLRQFVGDLAGPMTPRQIGEVRCEHVTLADHDYISDVYEFFWADLKPQIRGPLGLIAFFFKLILALAQIGTEGWPDTEKT